MLFILRQRKNCNLNVTLYEILTFEARHLCAENLIRSIGQK